MVDCRYCDRTFADEDAYLDHLRAEHAGELGPIDRRRAFPEESGAGIDVVPVALVAVIGVSAAIVAYVLFLSGGGGSSGNGAVQPHGLGSVHYHGTMEVVVEGERIDFSRSEYQLRADAFHFEGGEGTRWHVHARSVTLAYAMGTLGFDVGPGRVTVAGTTYRDDDPDTTVVVEVDGRAVAPAEYVLREGDHVRIVVRSG